MCSSSRSACTSASVGASGPISYIARPLGAFSSSLSVFSRIDWPLVIPRCSAPSSLFDSDSLSWSRAALHARPMPSTSCMYLALGMEALAVGGSAGKAALPPRRAPDCGKGEGVCESVLDCAELRVAFHACAQACVAVVVAAAAERVV
eukprot:3376089-Prymnesium_polylepis.1